MTFISGRTANSVTLFPLGKRIAETTVAEPSRHLRVWSLGSDIGKGKGKFAYVVSARKMLIHGVKLKSNSKNLREVMDLGLGQHRVVLQFRLPQWWCIATVYVLALVTLIIALRCNASLLKSAKRVGLIEERVSYAMMTSLAFPDRRDLRVEE
jgi:hypothetical protein